MRIAEISSTVLPSQCSEHAKGCSEILRLGDRKKLSIVLVNAKSITALLEATGSYCPNFMWVSLPHSFMPLEQNSLVGGRGAGMIHMLKKNGPLEMFTVETITQSKKSPISAQPSPARDRRSARKDTKNFYCSDTFHH